MKWDTKDTWKVYADYMSLGNYSVDSTGWAHILNTPGGDGLGGNGEKGYGLGISYMLADNTNWNLIGINCVHMIVITQGSLITMICII